MSVNGESINGLIAPMLDIQSLEKIKKEKSSRSLCFIYNFSRILIQPFQINIFLIFQSPEKEFKCTNSHQCIPVYVGFYICVYTMYLVMCVGVACTIAREIQQFLANVV